MELVTRDEAAKRAFVTPAMISIWAKKGRLTKHPNPDPKARSNSYLVDMDEVNIAHKISDWALTKIEDSNLVSVPRAAEMLQVTPATIHRWVSAYRIKKHPIPTSARQYWVDIRDIRKVEEDLHYRAYSY